MKRIIGFLFFFYFSTYEESNTYNVVGNKANIFYLFYEKSNTMLVAIKQTYIIRESNKG